MWQRKNYSRLLMVAVGSTLITYLCSFAIIKAAPANHLLIVELQTGSSSSASEEYIMLYNPTLTAVDVTGWKVQYASAVSQNWSSPTRNIALSGAIAPETEYVLASTGYLSDIADTTFSASLAASGGHVRLAKPDANNVLTSVDELGWGTAAMPEFLASAAPKAGQRLKRVVDQDENYIDTDNNLQDFAIDRGDVANTPASSSTAPSPQDQPAEATIPDSSMQNPEPENPQVDETSPEIVPVQSDLATPVITELLPDPAPPQTDAEDEFVELYNPNDQPLALSGYKLQTGTTFSHSYTFKEQVLAPQSYQAFYVRDTKATLANTAGQARLLAPDGSVVSVTDPYTKAPKGSSWVLTNGSWQWTIAPTPGIGNGLAIPALASSSQTKKLLASKKTTAKIAKPKAAKATKAAKKTTASGSSKSGGSTGILQIDGPIHPTVLAGVGFLAVGYALYEYRGDISNWLYQFKRYRATRRAAGPEPEGQ